ncbi:hypothetical protein LPB137_01475 [Poseidonibacter parvus]|uniref:histidine kinase n=1 Tax=Poseidonibacter parvus TaxID=1850254 RepID=A0A1P8KJ63_9BACT|nr:cache domain-containing protein [Poseidonibacter parvus]APW64600.1 hypothetical protein LPB137_01475 [Poseidonibacter parvus]
MDSIQKENILLKIIKYTPTILILLSSIFITTYITSKYDSTLKEEQKQIKKDFLESNKNRIKVEIDSLARLINNKIINEDKQLKDDLQDKINLATKIATNIYEKNKNKLSKEEIIYHIKNSIEALRFNDGQGYFSIHTLEGINILQPVHKEYQGTSVLNKKDLRGEYTVKKAIEIAKTKGEGFMSWYSNKPDDKTKQFEKLGIIKKIEPYNLIITTARFKDDYKKQIKKEVLTLLEVLNQSDHGFIFVINAKGDLLSTATKLANIKDAKHDFLKEYKNFLKSNNKSVYIEYQFSELNEEKYLKISYLKKIPIFDWVIATGFNYDGINLLVNKKQKELEEEYDNEILTIFTISIIVTLILLILSIILSKFIENIFYDYKQKLIEQETLKLESMLEEFNLIIDNLPMMMVLKDTKNNIITVNKAVANSLKHSVKELKNIPLKTIFPEDYEKYYEDDLEIIKTKKEKIGVIEYLSTRKGKRVLETSKIPIFNKEGEVQNIIIFILDVTEKEALKEDNQKKEVLLYQQSKMATMGEMIANISHQWKQPLSTITMASTGAKLQQEMDCLDPKQLTDELDTITHSAQYMAQTIDDFRNFFNPNSNNLKEFDLSSPFEKTLKLLMPKFKTQDIEVIKEIEDVQIKSLENEVIQILINLLNNARDELIKYKQRRLIFIKAKKENDSLILEIKDNAKGIDKEIKDKIFDAYFTTKESNEGTGLGLYMCKDILDKLFDANIKVENETYTYENEEYTGAKFTIQIKL